MTPSATLDALRSTEPVPYREALDCQRRFHADRVAGRIGDTLWLLEHPPVITVGLRRGQENNILIDPAVSGAEVVETDRGGEVTYHGPGQLVGYLFVGIERYGFRVRDFVARLEEGFISYLSDEIGLAARHDEIHTGVWVGNEKITAIGLALRKRVTLHGFAFNVRPDMSHFSWIVPCGIADRGVTSLETLTGESYDMGQVAADVTRRIREVLGYNEGPPPRSI